MKANVQIIKNYRRYSTDFKKAIVKDYESGQYSILQLARLHKIPHQLIYNWVYKFSIFSEKSYRIIEMKESTTKKLKELKAKVKELERMVGQKQIKIDYLEKMIEIAKEEYDIDIKKNSSTPPSAGSEHKKN